MCNRPNVLWICADQLRFDTLSINGDPIVETPNLERLCAMGVSFQNMYSQSPVCAPSRASFLTGRYPRTTLVRQNGQDIPASERLISKIFHDSGYACGLSGKLHLSACSMEVCPGVERRIDDGYDVFHWSHHPVYPNNRGNWVGNEYTWFLREKGILSPPEQVSGCKYVDTGVPAQYSQTAWCTDKAMEFIDAALALQKPFFFSINYYDPHHPFDPPAPLLEKYVKRIEQIPLPNYTQGELEQKPLFAAKDHRGAYETPGNYPFAAMNERDHKMLRAAYYAMIDLLDQNLGRLLDYLEQKNQLENTVILFHSDHGELLGDHGMYLKGPYFYECNVHVPFVMAWKNHLPAGQKRFALTELTDVAPTLAQLCGMEPQPQMQGRSFAHLLHETAEDSHREFVYAEYYNANINHRAPKAFLTMVYDGRYKLVRVHNTPGTVGGELYDLEADPGETNNRYNNPAYAKIKCALLERMTDAMALTADPLPLRRSSW